MRRYRTSQKIWAIVLTLVMVLGMIPATVTAVGEDYVTRVADPSTMNKYQELFLDPETAGVALTTENAGGVWTDKSVFAADAIPSELTDATSVINTKIDVDNTGDNFLVALSAVASNKEIVGYSTRPTDTMLVLDLSGSMKGSTSAMVTAANKAVGDLLALNEHNRVGVVLFSGRGTTGNSDTSTATVLMPLGRYTTTSYTGNGSNRVPQYIRSNNSEQVSVASGVSPRTGLGSAKNTNGGTYTQNGIYQAMNQLVNAEDKVIPEGSLQAGTTRLPILVLMSDGEPTAATKNYTNIGTSDVGTGGMNKSYQSDMSFLTQLTMAYAKREIENAYATDSRLYTLGYSVADLPAAICVLDPSYSDTPNRVNNLWNTYLSTDAGGSFNINAEDNQGKSVTKHTDPAGKYTKALEDYRYYTDEYFEANRSSDLTAAFQSIVNEIILQSKYYPTYVEKDHDHDGYVTFTDKIGGYMDVTNIHGIVIGDTLFSGEKLARDFEDGTLFGTVQNPSDLGNDLVWSVKERLHIDDVTVARTLLNNAYNYDQMGVAADGSWSNYIGWYSDAAGNYLDFWDESLTTDVPEGATHIIKSYGMLGPTDAAHGISAADMMYASIRVSKELDDYDQDGIAGETFLTWQIPASLVPTITYQVTVEADAAGEITDVQKVELENANVKPIRLLYEVALQEDIHEWNIADKVSAGYRDSTANKDSGYAFYTNQWKKEDGTTDTTRNTYSHFEPSVQNEWYYYTEDTIICTDESGTEYTGAAAPSTSGTYYRSYWVYEKMDNGTYRMHPHYEQISAESLANAERSGNNWVIPKGTVFRFWDPFREQKTANSTATHAYAEYPTIVYNESAGHYYAYDVLGNNGKLIVAPAAGIKVTKTVDEVVAGVSNTFTFEISGGTGNATLVRLNQEGEEASRQDLIFAEGKAEFTISADETVYIIGLADGVTYTISEKDNENYKVSSVTVNGQLITGTTAQITAAAQTIQSADFVNSIKGEGGLFIVKEVTSDTSFPAGTQFDLTVTLEGNENADYRIFAANMADPSGAPVEITDYTETDGVISGLKIVHGQTIYIGGLTEGTVATVAETAPTGGFALAGYTSINFSGDTPANDGDAVIHKDRNATVNVKNTYTAKAAELKLNFAGIKNFDAEQMTEDATFTFRLQQYVNGAWADVDTAEVTIPAGTKDASKNFSFDSLELSFNKEGAYSCQILEDLDDNTDITYDRSVYTFSVIVTDNGDGTLMAEVVANVDPADAGNFSVTQGSDDWTVTTVFNNEYHTTATNIDIKKAVTDKAGSGKTGQGFVVESYNASVDADGVWNLGSFIRSATTDAEGEARLVRNYDNTDFENNDADGDNVVTYHFIIKEKHEGKAGWKYDPTHYLVAVVLTRTEDADGTESITADFTIHKGVAGENNTFTAGDKVNVSGDTAILTFANTFDPSDAQVDLNIVPTVMKHLEGRQLNAGEFTFYIYADGDRQTVLATGTNDAQGKVKFDKKLTFDKVGTYAFDIVEEKGSLGGVTYDETVYDMVVSVTENSGVLSATYFFEDSTTKTVTFENRYDAAKTSIVIEGSKTLTGKPMVNAEFGFTLTEVTDATGATAVDGGVTRTAANNPDNNGDQTASFAFGAIEYTEPGVYYYLIAENGAGTTVNGVTYTEKTAVVKVTVTDPGDGQLKAASEVVAGGDLAFTNTYVPQPTHTKLSSSKQLTGRVMVDGEFEFTLTEKTDATYATDKTGGEKQTVKNDANGKITFATLTFDKAGDYYYVIEEAEGSAGGVSYDNTKYQIHISVVDNHQGKLVATTDMVMITVEDDETVQQPTDTIVFHNIYTIDGEDELPLSGIKHLDGKDLEAGAFSFGLFDSEGKLIEEVTNAESGTFTFEPLSYDETNVGNTYTYTVKEILPKVDGEEVNVYEGVTYDTTVYQIEATVSDDGEGGITVSHTINGDETAEILFENSYTISGQDTVTLSGTKTLSGFRTQVQADEFSFGLYEGTEEIEVVKVKAGGTFAFTTLTYGAEDIGEHTYTVKEIIPEGAVSNKLNGYTYDATVYTVVVDVKDNGKGGVEASATINDGAVNAIAFTNKYEVKSAEVNLKGTKTYDKGLKGDDFTFTLEGEIDGQEIKQEKKNTKEGDIFFDTLTFTKEGTYEFSVKEIDQVLGFIEYSKEVYEVVVEVTDNGKGQLVYELTVNDKSNGDIVFENVYQYVDAEDEVTIFGTKKLTGFRTQVQADEFSFGLYEGTEEIEVVKVKADGTFAFKTLTYGVEDIGEHTYTVKEIIPEGAVSNKLNGYTYDATVYTVTVTVIDDNEGNIVATSAITGAEAIVFTNKYEVKPAEVNLKGTKTYDKGLKGDDFTFALEGEIDGQEIKQEKKNTKEGDIFFDTLTFTKEGTYEFSIKEKEEALGFIEYSKEVYEVVVEVSDNGKGQLVYELTVNDKSNGEIKFENVYKYLDAEDEVTIFGTKKLTGFRNQPKAGEFTFGLYEGEELLEQVTNAADGSFSFPTRKYGVSDIGEHIYTVKEIIPEGAVSNKLNGYTYDATIYTVTVTVIDDNEGNIVATSAITGAEAIVFTNKYEVKAAEVNLKGTKTYDKGLKGDDFTFILEGEIDGQEIKQEKKNTKEGDIFFDTLTFTKEGTYEFSVKEIDQVLGFIEYSKEVYEVVVEVSDNGKGQLVYELTVNDKSNGEIKFENVYKYLDAEDEVTIFGTKKLTGFRNQVQADEFSFGLYEGTEEIEVVKVKADGTFSFKTLTYGVEDIGEHTYTVKEIIPEDAEEYKLNGYTYDATVYTVTVKVEDDNQGNIVATSAITGAEAIVFTNKYEVKAAEVNLKGTKTYDKGLAGDDFTFTLEGEIDGQEIKQEKKNTKEGDIFFDTLTFTKEGEYEFAVKETAEALGFVQYAKEVYKVQITVTDDGKGQLVAAVTVNDKADGKMEFVNDYTLVDADNELTLSGTKTLVGRDLAAGEFSFGLYDESGKLLETVTNDASGKFTFSKLTYQIQENESATYTYAVKEMAGSDPSVTYDKTVYTVVVKVADDNKGGTVLTYTVNGTANGAITFTNVYTKPADVTAKIYIQKIVVNKTEPGIGLKDFTFVMTHGDAVVEAKSDEQGKAGFQVTFGANDIGKTFEFKVSEKKGSTAGMTYDTTVYTVTVKVSQNADGSLALTINDKAADSISLGFTNTYEKPATPVTGDSFPLMLLGVLMLLSAAGIAVLLMTKSKKRGKYMA